MKCILIFLVMAVICTAFMTSKTQWRRSIVPKSTWQDDVESILDIDSSCENRKELVRELRSKTEDIRKDVREAVRERDIEKIAPSDKKYGKDLRALKAFNAQLRNDILPDLLNNGFPSLLTEGPKLASELLNEAGGAKGLAKQARAAVERIQEMSEDPSALQYTLDEVRTELKNVVKSTPEGLDSPAYEVLRKTDAYEIREYAAYAVATTRIDNNEEVQEKAMASGMGFNKLAGYILEGENAEEEKMSMTTPVITDRDTMSFVMPSGRSADLAPAPNNADITVSDVPKQVVAVREFTGLVTERESVKQRAALEDALVRDGVDYDNLSFKALQYNPPYTLPWVRRNEVLLVVTSPIAKDVVAEPVVESDGASVEGATSESAPSGAEEGPSVEVEEEPVVEEEEKAN